jgi:hypothetical protein
LVSGEAIAASSRMFVTSTDGLNRVNISRDEFYTHLHAEQELTMSADWLLEGLIDGYVVGTCKHDGRMATEYYQYGMLDRFEATFLDLLFGRFVALARGGGCGLLAIDASGMSGEGEWRKVYSGIAEIPETAVVMAMPIGAYRGHIAKLTRAFEVHGIEVFATPS